MATFNIIMPPAIVTNYKPKDSLCTFGRRKTSKVACSIVRSIAKTSDEVINTGDEASIGRRSGNYAQSSSSQKTPCDHILDGRRSGNYAGSLWDFDYIQSLSTQFPEDRYVERASELVVQVKKLLEEELTEPIQQLEMIDDLQKMGLSYHFEDEINKILKSMYADRQNKYNGKNSKIEKDLYSTALEFRLFRQHGFTIGQEVFDCFKNDKGDFKANLSDDTRGLLQLYEASFLLTEGEETLEKANEFSTPLLRKTLDDEDNNGILIDENLSLLVHNALELPTHWRIQRPNARWFIDAYERRTNINSIVLDLAKLDFNIVQGKFLQELKEASRWWKQTSFPEYLPFARDRLVECYVWATGFVSHPRYGHARILAAKFNALITAIDDIFDVYGSLEELQLFHDVIQRWDTEAIDQLPHYMQICYLALDSFVNETAYSVLKEKGVVVITHLRKFWANLCRAYLQESKWYLRGYTPTLEEYMNIAWISISAPVILSHICFLLSNPIEDEAIQCLYKDDNIMRYSAMILRLADDLGTSSDELERGDVPKSVECYMNESNASREEAEVYVRTLIRKTWKKMNEERVRSYPFQQIFVESAVNVGRMAQFMYQNGDGFGVQNDDIKQRISTLLFEPIL